MSREMRRDRVQTGARRAMLLLAGLCVAMTPVHAWCELVFKDIVDQAAVVVLAEYESPRGEQPRMRVVDTLHGEDAPAEVAFVPDEMARYRPRHGDRFVIALNDRGAPLRYVRGMGACSAISILPIKKGQLRAADRPAYDGSSKPMKLDELRREFER